MDIKSIAASMLLKKIGGNSGAINGVMDKLVGDGDKMDVGSLIGGLQSKGLGDIAESWLGDGANKDISADQLKDVLGAEKISAAAAELGTDEGSLLGGLQSALPQMVDKASQGGSLLGSLGGLGALGSIAKKML